MRDIVERMRSELKEWVCSINFTDPELILEWRAHAYVVKKEIITYFESVDTVPKKIENLLADDGNVNLLETVYGFYMYDDSANIQEVVANCVQAWLEEKV